MIVYNDNESDNGIEIRSRSGNTHLAYLYNDGPNEEGGLRYSINSSSLNFISYEDMKKEGFEEFKVYIK